MVSDLASWTLKISQQQEENDKLQREENERLEADIAVARKAREARKSGFRSPGVSYTSKFQPPATSSPSIPSLPSSSTPRSNGPSAINNTSLPSSSSARHALPPPSSLATMMGSSEQGPRLTRAPAGGDGRIGASSSAAGGVGLPGLAGGRGGARTGGGGVQQQEQEVERAPSRWKSSATTSSSSAAGDSTSKTLSPVKPVGGGYQQKLNLTSTLPFERASASTKVNVPSSTSISTSASASTPRPFSFTSQRSSTVPVPAPTSSSSSQQQHRSKPSYGNSSTSPTTTPSASLLLRPIPTPTPAPPVLSGSTAAPSQAFTRPSSSERGPTASLTRLKGRGIVEEQLRKSRLREEGEEGGLAGISEFGSPALGGGEWDGNRSGGKASSSPKLMSSNGSGGFPRSLQRSPSLSSTPSTTTYTSTSTATAQPFLPPNSSATDAFPVLRPTRRHQTSASISQIPFQPPPPLSTTASRHRPTASVGKLPTINSLAKEEHQQQPLRVRTTGKLFASKQIQEPTTSSSSPIIPQIPGSPRVSVRNFVKSVETASPVVVEPPTGRRQFGGGGPAVSFPSSSSTPVSQPIRSSTTPHPPPKASRTPSPTTTITHRVQPPPRRTTTSVTSSTSDSHHSHSYSHTSPPLSNPYSAFFVPSSSNNNAPTTTAIVVPRPPSPIKPPTTNQGIGLPGLALSPELSSSKRYLEHVEQVNEAKPLERKHIRGVGLPGMVATAVEKKEEVVAPPAPTKSKFDFERPSSPIKKGFFQPQTTMVAPARPGSPSKLDARPASPSKVAFPSVVDAPPASPTKRGFALASSATKSVEQPESSSVKLTNGGGGVTVGVLKSSATPVRVRKESRGSSSGVDQVEAAAAASRAGEKRLPISPSGSGGLFHPTRDRARKPKPKTNRTSLTSSPSNKPTLAVATKPVVVVPPIPPVPTLTASTLARQRPVSPTKPSASFNDAPPPPSPTKLTFKPTPTPITTDASLPPPSPTKREFQSGNSGNVAQRRSVWGDQAPIGVARPLSSYGGQETVGEKEVGGEEKKGSKEEGGEKKVAKVPKGTFGGEALPGMVFVEKKEEEAKEVKRVEEVEKIVVPEKKKEEEKPTLLKTRVVDPPLPRISISTLLALTKPTNTPPQPPSLTLSLEILSISSSGQTTPVPTATPNSPWIFYASEMLAVVHRSKSRETGLVSSKVWGWKGRRVDSSSSGGGKAGRKLEEVAKRLSAGVIEVKQGEEDQELMAVLGNKLVIRQGERDHFSSENTSLYTVQQLQGSILIDEVDLLPSSLTSRHSLVLTVLSQVFLFHGQGSLRTERIAGRQYAAILAKDSPSDFIELEESAATKSEDHELFWMCFGEEEEGEGSSAWHWKFRSGLEEDEGRGCSVENGKVTPINSLLAGDVFESGIKLVLVSFEIFVVVAQNARGRRQDIRLALHLAERISRSIQTSRPFKPPVHALILPSKIPSDLKTYFRYLDEDELNGGQAPSHMNVRSLDEAREHLSQASWSSSMLRDETFLPLGVAPRSG